MKKVLGILVALILFLALAGPVLSAYAQLFTVTNTTTTTYSMIPFLVTDNNTVLASSGFISSTARDTRVKWGGTALPHMVSDNKTLFATSILANTTKSLTYGGGETAQDMYIVLGYGGTITTLDDPDLEPGDDFMIEADGYLDTSASQVGQSIVSKASAFTVNISAASTITATTLGSPSAQVSATSVSSGYHPVTVRGVANYPQWATGGVLNFVNGDANSQVAMGAVYNSAATWWVSFWVRPTVAAPVGNQYIIGKYLNDPNQMGIFFSDGQILFREYTSGNVTGLTSTAASWPTTTWTHVIVSQNTAGQRMVINGGAETKTSASVDTLPAGGTLLLGAVIPGSGTASFAGQISNVVWGTDNLTPDEETALYAGTAPGDETDYYWYIDEGTGNTVYSYGSAANHGLKGSATTWTTSTYTSGKTGRLADFSIQVDSSRWGTNLKGASVPDNANDFIWGSSATPYWQTITARIDSDTVLLYQPNAIILGDVLPDRNIIVPPNDGLISWGTNPAGVSVTISPTYTTSTIGATSSGIAPIITDTPTAPSGMYRDTTPDTTYIFFAPLINAGLDAGDIPRQLFWVPLAFATAIWAFVAVMHRTKGKELLLASAAAEIVLLIWWMGGNGVIPGWPLFTFPIPAIVAILRGNQFSWRS